MGWLLRKQGVYAEAEQWLARARETYQQADDTAGVSHVLTNIGEIHRLQGKFDEARRYYDESLQLAEHIVDPHDRQAARAHALAVIALQGEKVQTGARIGAHDGSQYR